MGHKLLSLPGLSGHYADTPDINLLDADTAHLHQSIGTWVDEDYTDVTLETDQPMFGDNSLRVIITPDLVAGPDFGAGSFTDMSLNIPISPNTEYTHSADMYLDTAGGALTAAAAIRWHESDGTLISTVAAAHVALTLGQITRLSHTATSPANAAFGHLNVRLGTSTIGDVVYYGRVRFSQDAVSTFVPSLRIVGSVDMEALMAAAVWGSGEQLAIGNRSGNLGYELTFGSAVQTFARHQTGAARQTAGIFATGKVDGQYSQMRAYFDVPAGEWNFVQDAESDLANGGFTTIPGVPVTAGAGARIDVGARDGTGVLFTGKVKWAEVRDGIDGPVVVRFDADDFAEGDSDGATAVGSVDGRTWTLHGAATLIEAPLSEGVVVLTDGTVTGLTLTDE